MASPPTAHPVVAPRLNAMNAWARYLWAAPLVLSVTFTAMVVAWAQDNDKLERETLRRTVMADTLSLNAQLAGRLEAETARLRTAAAQLPMPSPDGSRQLANLPEIAAGLDRRWLSVVWLDNNGQIVGEASRDLRLSAQRLNQGNGITLHLAAPTRDEGTAQAGQLIARYDPADLIKSKDFWWLAAQYEVQLLTGQDQVIVSTAGSGRIPVGESYDMPFSAIADAKLRLTQRVRQPHWFSTLPVILMVGFLALITTATLLLRRQMNQVLRAESAWRTEAAWRQSLEESALVGLRARNMEGRLLFANRTFCDLVGYSLAELMEHPPETDIGKANKTPTNKFHERPEGQETRWRHRDGHMIDVMVFESPLVDGMGQQVGWMGSIVDVTERKRLEELERRQREVLANHARLSTLGEVASTLAHELNQPLTSIVSYSAGIAKALSHQEGLDPELLAAAQALSRHASQAGDIVHRIRNRLSRRDPILESCVINVLVDQAVSLLRRDLRRAGIEVDLELDPNLMPVSMDRIGIEQVVSNLVRNAIDAMASIGAKTCIRIRTYSSSQPPLGYPPGWVTVEVTDKGPGLGGRDIESLTEPFFSTKKDGTGLGLAICRSILESHGGVLYARDHPSGGAEFSFSLPPDPPCTQADMS
jgi:two-component system sensor histidine kinase DctS